MGVVEATMAGYFDTAAKSGVDLFISTFMPSPSSHITAIKSVNSGVKSLVKIWTDDLYNTQAYSKLEDLVHNSRNSDSRPYIPSI